MPPRIAFSWISSRLHPDERDEILGDLHEQFVQIAAVRGDAAARRWYWRQAMALAWGFSMARRDVISTAHERRRGAWAAGNFAADARGAWRSLQHSRAFTGVALLTLTFGIGLSTAVFSLVRGVLLNPLPYPHADRLVHLSEFDPRHSVPATGGDMTDVTVGMWVARHRAIEQLAPYSLYKINITLPGGLTRASVADVGGDFFATLETTPVIGRLLGPADLVPGAPPVVISERLWRSGFGGRQDAIGQLITTEVETHAIVGVVPGTFQFPNDEVDVWRAGVQFRRYPSPGAVRQMSSRPDVIGRLREGASLVDAEREGNDITQAIAAADPNFLDGTVTPTRVRAVRLIDEIVAPVRAILTTLGVGMVLVLVAACVNLANLLLARDTARQRDVAIRLSLGASRWRIARPILLEQCLLAATGGGAGALLAWWLLRALPVFVPSGVPRISSIHFDAAALLFTVLASLLTAIGVSVAPVFRADDRATRELSASRGRVATGGATASADRFRGALVVMQVALATVLLVGALLIGRSLSALMHVNPGYRPDGVLVFQATQPYAAVRSGRAGPYFDALLARLRQHPDVVSAGYASVLPMRPMSGSGMLVVSGRPIDPIDRDPRNWVVKIPISPGYLETIGNRLVRGRGFTESDIAGAPPVVLIDEALERKFFPDGGAIGAQIIGVPRGMLFTIVGVTESIHVGALAEAPLPVMYYNTAQIPPVIGYTGAGSGVAIRTHGDPSALMDFVTSTAREVDPHVPLHNMRLLVDDISTSVAQPRFFTVALGLFAALALSTALLGLYGVLAYAVERRRPELALRRALGATERHVIGLVMRRGAVMAVAGLGAGLVAAALGARLMRSMLFGVTPADPASYAVTAILIVSVVAVASWRPVRHALDVDPAVALKTD